MLVQVKIHDHAGTIILNRPEKRNALSRRLLADLDQALDDLHGMRSVRAVILTGAGSAFCAGMDLAEMHATAEQPEQEAQRQWHDDAAEYRDLLERMLRFPKPIIAAVNGPAIAGGAGLVFASDLVIAARSATFALPEPLRGLVAGIISPLLVFRAGGSVAARLLLTAEPIDADEALRMHLVHEVVADDVIWARAFEVAGLCSRGSPEALQLTKKILNETIGENLSTLLSAGAAASATARTTEGAAEGLKAFLEKRQPKWP